MPIFEGKKVLNVGVKVNEQQQMELQAICDKEDRPMSYVMRELAMRGLALYKQDGSLKLTEEEEKILKQVNISMRGGAKISGDVRGEVKKTHQEKITKDDIPEASVDEILAREKKTKPK